MPGGVALLEAGSGLGGKIATEHHEGFVLEGGPDCFLAAKPAGVALCEALGLTGQLIGTSPACRRAYVKRSGRLHELPEGLSGMVPARLGPLFRTRLLSPIGRLRAGLELFVPRRSAGEDESIAAFVARRFGREAYDWLVEPLLSGIYAGDGARLSLEATFPRLRRLEQERGSVMASMLFRGAAPAMPGGSNGRAGFVTLRGGLAGMVHAIAARLPAGTVRTGEAVHTLEADATGYHLRLAGSETLHAGHVVLAVPAFEAARLLQRIAPEAAAELSAIPYVSTATISLGYRPQDIPRPFTGSGYVSPRAEGGPVVAATWTSNKFPGRAPDGHVLIRLFLGRDGNDGIARRDSATVEEVGREELRRVFGITAPPLFARVFRWPNALPQYLVGHERRLERVAERLAGHPGLHLAGSAYRGVGIPDCIAQGWQAADQILRSPAGRAA
jgi:oxygen-dependent protoporphyrinogen oxidase